MPIPMLTHCSLSSVEMIFPPAGKIFSAEAPVDVKRHATTITITIPAAQTPARTPEHCSFIWTASWSVGFLAKLVFNGSHQNRRQSKKKALEPAGLEDFVVHHSIMTRGTTLCPE